MQQPGFPQTLYFNAGPFTSNGDSGLILCPGITNIQLACILTSFTGGTSPTFTFLLDQQDPAGNWLTGTIATSALSTAGQSYGSTAPQFLSGRIRGRWVLAGAPTSVQAVVSLMGW